MECKTITPVICNRGIHIGKVRVISDITDLVDPKAPVLFTRDCDLTDVEDARSTISYDIGFHAEVSGNVMLEDPEIFDTITVYIDTNTQNISNVIARYVDAYKMYDNVWFVITGEPEWVLSVTNQIKIDHERVMVNIDEDDRWFIENNLNKYISRS